MDARTHEERLLQPTKTRAHAMFRRVPTQDNQSEGARKIATALDTQPPI